MRCGLEALVHLDEDQRHWTALTRVASASSFVMHCDPCLDVCRRSDVQGLIGAANNVDEGHTTTMQWIGKEDKALRLATLAQGIRPAWRKDLGLP